MSDETQFDQIFNQFDKDRNGIIQKSEMARFIKKFM